jgi:hypothetical protein
MWPSALASTRADGRTEGPFVAVVVQHATNEKTAICLLALNDS